MTRNLRARVRRLERQAEPEEDLEIRVGFQGEPTEEEYQRRKAEAEAGGETWIEVSFD